MRNGNAQSGLVIRAGTNKDIPRVVELSKNCHTWLHYEDRCGADPDRIFDLAALFISSPEHLLLIAEKDSEAIGVIALALVTHVFSGERVGTELLWWVQPEARSGGTAIALLEAGENWVREMGGVRIEMVSPAGSDLGKLYKRRSYVPLETVHQLGLR
jgi:GNAT superfamily N-acetyltransferase